MSVNDSISAPPVINGLIEPDQIAYSYNTLGWKMVLVAVISTTIIGLFLWVRSFIKNAYRRKALKEIEQIATLTENLSTLKQVALAVYGRKKVAGLYGDEWVTFLDKQCKESNFQGFSKTIEQVINGGASQADELLLKEQIIKWIKYHVR